MAATRLILALVSCAVLLAQAPPSHSFSGSFMPEQTRRNQMYAFVDANIPPLPRYTSLEQWKHNRSALRTRLLRLSGIEDIRRMWVPKNLSTPAPAKRGFVVLSY